MPSYTIFGVGFVAWDGMLAEGVAVTCTETIGEGESMCGSIDLFVLIDHGRVLATETMATIMKVVILCNKS